jgi:hypothetical protein
MLPAQFSLDAYRLDRAKHPERERLTSADEELVRLGMLLQKRAELSPSIEDAADVEELTVASFALADVVLALDGRRRPALADADASATMSERLSVHVRAAADVAEQGGAVALANALLLLVEKQD